MLKKRQTKISAPTLTKPIVSGSENVWGNILNENIDKTDDFNKKILQNITFQNDEIVRLDNSKLSKEDLESEVKPILNNLIENDSKPAIDRYVEETSKPSIDSYIASQKTNIDRYVEETSKPSIDSYVEGKKLELENIYEAEVKPVITEDIQNYISTVSKPSIDEFTQTKITEVEKEGEKQLELINNAVSGLPERVDNLEKNKLDSGGYAGTALDLKELIDNKTINIEKTTSEEIVSMLNRVRGGEK